MSEFFPAEALQTIIKNTDGRLVEYRGQEAYFHFEEPSYEDAMAIFGHVQTIANILIGDATAFRDLEQNKLISVEGDDYLVAEWKTPGDGSVIYIALKTDTRV